MRLTFVLSFVRRSHINTFKAFPSLCRRSERSQVASITLRKPSPAPQLCSRNSTEGQAGLLQAASLSPPACISQHFLSHEACGLFCLDKSFPWMHFHGGWCPNPVCLRWLGGFQELLLAPSLPVRPKVSFGSGSSHPHCGTDSAGSRGSTVDYRRTSHKHLLFLALFPNCQTI